MGNLVTNIQIAKDIQRVVRRDVVRVVDYDEDSPPVIVVKLQLYGPSSIMWPTTYTLAIRDGVESDVIRINPSPTNPMDQFVSQRVVLSGTPYTTLAAAYNANNATGDRAGRRKAVDDLLVPVGALESAFAVT